MADSARPDSDRIFIYIACLIGFFGFLPTFFFSFSELAYMIGHRYINFLQISSLLLWVSLIAIWKMKKWAVFAYTVTIIAIQIVQISYKDSNSWDYMSLIIPTLITVTIWYHFKKMS